MNVIYMGTPDFAVSPLEAILKAGHTVLAVVTQPDKQKGRGKEIQMTPVKECAVKHGIPVLQPVKIREAQAVAELKQYSAELFVIAAFGQILSEEILTMPKYGCINIHASLLPKYRGAAPIQKAIIDGEKESGVTIQQMEKGIDTGDMLLKKIVAIEEKETGQSLHDKLMEAGALLVTEALEKIERNEVIPIKQKEEDASYAGRLTKAMGQINWSKDAISIERLVRGLNSWPSAYTSYKGKTLKLWETEVVHESAPGAPGTVVRVSKEYMDVVTGEDLLRIKELQLEGKKRLSVRDFLLGYEVAEGFRFN